MLLLVLVAAVALGIPAVLSAHHDLPAEPAEVGPARRAGAPHVVAAAVLLDRHLALGAVLFRAGMGICYF